MSGEFDLIAKYFRPLAGPEGLGLQDDAACVQAPEGHDLIVTKDMLVEGVHFTGREAPASLAIKCLAVNLSDLAAKGAKPFGYWLAISLPKDIPEEWISAFAEGLGGMQHKHGISLMGGDTTASLSGVTVSITALGLVPTGSMIRRDGAAAGDDIYVSGTLGDAALGLKAVLGEIHADASLVDRYQHPVPRLLLGRALRGLVTACADVSDGFLADARHIAAASCLGARIDQALLPVSDCAQAVLGRNPELEALVYSGGDDYELVFTASPENRQAIADCAETTGVPLTRVGSMFQGEGVRLVDPDGKLVQACTQGYDHFSGKK